MSPGRGPAAAPLRVRTHLALLRSMPLDTHSGWFYCLLPSIKAWSLRRGVISILQKGRQGHSWGSSSNETGNCGLLGSEVGGSSCAPPPPPRSHPPPWCHFQGQREIVLRLAPAAAAGAPRTKENGGGRFCSGAVLRAVVVTPVPEVTPPVPPPPLGLGGGRAARVLGRRQG